MRHPHIDFYFGIQIPMLSQVDLLHRDHDPNSLVTPAAKIDLHQELPMGKLNHFRWLALSLPGSTCFLIFANCYLLAFSSERRQLAK